MAWTAYQKILAIVMVVTGSINTLSTKWADREKARGLDGGEPRKFNHPFLQAVGMFIGEFTCLVVFHCMRCILHFSGRRMEVGTQNFNPLIFLPAALCDMCGTSLMYIGLNLTFASSFQMLRGAVIIFTALLSVAFLGRTVKPLMWVGIISVIAGLALVGVSDIIFGSTEEKDTNGVIAGDLLIIMAQIIVSVQMVYEEKFISRYNVPPLQAVGWEGLFGALILGLLLIPFYYINAGAFSKLPDHRLENALDAFQQMANNWKIALATLGNIVSIAFFNFAGISVTKEMSATTRMVLDSIRTLVIWVVALSLTWQMFHYVQVFGFILLLIGMCLYNGVIIQPGFEYIRNRRQNRLIVVENDQEPLLGNGPAAINEPRRE